MQTASEIPSLVPERLSTRQVKDEHFPFYVKGFDDCINLISPKRLEVVISEELLLQAAARGYCTGRNKHKEVDSSLLEDIVNAIILAAKQDKDLVKIVCL